MNPRLKFSFLKPFLFFLLGWGVINLFQAYLTPLNDDEAYYWMYSKYLAWGYFDHPPMIALIIKIGYFFFHNELGVRIIVVLSQLFGLYIIWLLTDNEKRRKKEDILLFFILVSILPVYNIFVFVATPDAPLILFSAIFLLAYKRFLKEENWQNVFFLGFSMAALMYSKYHGLLLIILVILSNLRLFKSKWFYISILLAVLFYIPHIYWQYSNGFPSLRYHLVDRISGFDLIHLPEYLFGQLFIHNPLLLPVIFWILIKVRSENLFDKSMRYIIIGFFAFFFVSSFRYRVEANWTDVVCIPMIIILINNVDYKPWIRKLINRSAIIIFPLIIFARLAYAVDLLPITLIRNNFHGKKQWVKDISALAGDRIVVFTHSYQRPSVYTFYSGKFAHTLDDFSYRKTQYDLWDFEEKIHGHEVLFVPHFFPDSNKMYLTKHILTDGDSVFVKVYKDFQSLQRECVILSDDHYTFSRNGLNNIKFKIFNPYPYRIDFKHKELPIVFQISFIKNYYIVFKKNLNLPENVTKLEPGDTVSVDCKFTIENLPDNKYKFGISSETGILFDTFNSKFKEARIKE